MDPKGVVAFFPSDHHFSHDEAFVAHIDSASPHNLTAHVPTSPQAVPPSAVPTETAEENYLFLMSTSSERQEHPPRLLTSVPAR